MILSPTPSSKRCPAGALPLKRLHSHFCHYSGFLIYLAQLARRFIYRAVFKEEGFSLMRRSPCLKTTRELFLLRQRRQRRQQRHTGLTCALIKRPSCQPCYFPPHRGNKSSTCIHNGGILSFRLYFLSVPFTRTAAEHGRESFSPFSFHVLNFLFLFFLSVFSRYFSLSSLSCSSATMPTLGGEKGPSVFCFPSAVLAVQVEMTHSPCEIFFDPLICAKTEIW